MTRLYDQDQQRRPLTSASKRRLVHLVGLSLVLTVCVVVVAVSALGATSNVRPGCGYTIRQGDTLTRISNQFNVPLTDLVTVNNIQNPNRIFAGDRLDRCALSVVSGDRPSLSDAPLPGHAAEWARAVVATRPGSATDADVRLLVALAGPESAWCTATENHGDANPPVWGHSFGCVQIRTMLRPVDLESEPWRDLSWLHESYNNQAEAAWVVYERQGRAAWGPARTTRNQLKLADDCMQVAVNRRDACAMYWHTADRALEQIGG